MQHLFPRLYFYPWSAVHLRHFFRYCQDYWNTWSISSHLRTFSPTRGRYSWKLSFLDDFKLECLIFSHFVLVLGEFHTVCFDRISSPRSCHFSRTHAPDPSPTMSVFHSSQRSHHSSEIPGVLFWWLRIERDRTKDAAVVPCPWRSS